jgi:DNA mismatch repair protein MutS2
MNVISAKAKYAQRMDIFYQIFERSCMRDAYHPLLYLTNKEKETTFPQSIGLEKIVE